MSNLLARAGFFFVCRSRPTPRSTPPLRNEFSRRRPQLKQSAARRGFAMLLKDDSSLRSSYALCLQPGFRDDETQSSDFARFSL